LFMDAFEEMTHLIDSSTVDQHIDAKKSGTTATVIVHDTEKDLLTVGYVGDSGVAIARGLNHTAEYLTPDHTAEIDAEMRRIDEYGGRVEYDGHSYRVYLMHESGPGLNMSRAFGDLQGRPAGIISVPDVYQVKLSKTDQFIVLCSDGIWEFISAEDATEIVHQSLVNHKNPAEDLAVESLKRWNMYADVVDDITCIVIDFNQSGARHDLHKLKQSGGCENETPEQHGEAHLASSNTSAEDYDVLFEADIEHSQTIMASPAVSPTGARAAILSKNAKNGNPKARGV